MKGKDTKEKGKTQNRENSKLPDVPSFGLRGVPSFELLPFSGVCDVDSEVGILA